MIAAILGLELAAFIAWWSYSRCRLGRVELTNVGAPLTVQVLDESGEHPLGEPIDVIQKATLTLPDGDYRLRVTGNGRLGRTPRFAVNRGETIAHQLSLDEGRLLGREKIDRFSLVEAGSRDQPIPYAPIVAALELKPGTVNFIESTSTSLIRRNAVNGNVIWDAVGSHRAWQPGRDPSTWYCNSSGSSPSRIFSRDRPLTWMATARGDLVWAFSSAPSIFALSGADGSLLWTYRAEPDGPGGPSPETPEPTEPVERLARRGHVLGAPELADLDRDGTPDLIVTVKFAESPEEQERRSAEEDRRGLAQDQRPPALRRVIAVSGRSGRWLWSSPVDRSFTSFEESSWNRPETIVRGRASAMVAILSGSQWLGLDTATGRPIAGPIDLGFVPVRPVQDADLDGDGMPEILALGPGPAAGQQVLSAFSTGTGFEPWTVTVNVQVPEDRRCVPDPRSTGRDPFPSELAAGRGPRRRRPVRGVRPRRRADAAGRRLPRPAGPRRPHRPDSDGCGRCASRTTANDGREELPRRRPDLDGDGTRATWWPSRSSTAATRPRRPGPSPRRLGESTSMRSRARTAVRSGSGAWTCRSSRSPASRRPNGGAAGRMAGRSWPSRSAVVPSRYSRCP